MSKIDEIKQMIEIRYADLKELDCYSPETVLILLEQLRPYVELGEILYNWDISTQDELRRKKITELKQQTKEQK
jgi:hypothetical protein